MTLLLDMIFQAGVSSMQLSVFGPIQLWMPLMENRPEELNQALP